jgi:membrane protease YdiL (CAAX protease family)
MGRRAVLDSATHELDHGREAMASSLVRQTRARMHAMPFPLRRTFSRILESTPNYVEITAVLTAALIARLLFMPHLWRTSPQACAAAALFVSAFLYFCVDKGELLSYFGWSNPRRSIYWLCAPVAGAAAALAVIGIVRHAGLGLGADTPGRLLYGVTIGPILEEVLFRGVAFSAICVTASSIRVLARTRIVLAISLSSMFVAVAHTTTVGVPWVVFLGMGICYALFRWRSNSTATAALMHAAYNSVIAYAMLRQ